MSSQGYYAPQGNAPQFPTHPPPTFVRAEEVPRPDEPQVEEPPAYDERVPQAPRDRGSGEDSPSFRGIVSSYVLGQWMRRRTQSRQQQPSVAAAHVDEVVHGPQEMGYYPSYGIQHPHAPGDDRYAPGTVQTTNTDTRLEMYINTGYVPYYSHLHTMNPQGLPTHEYGNNQATWGSTYQPPASAYEGADMVGLQHDHRYWGDTQQVQPWWPNSNVPAPLLSTVGEPHDAICEMRVHGYD